MAADLLADADSMNQMYYRIAKEYDSRSLLLPVYHINGEEATLEDVEANVRELVKACVKADNIRRSL